MYTNYFGLKEKPFSITRDPRFLYMGEVHREALAHLLYGTGSSSCFILLTGDLGTGKTTVCRCLIAQLSENTDVALISNPRLTSVELLESICAKLGIETVEKKTDPEWYLELIREHLCKAHGMGRHTVLLIDEAQNLSLELFEQLRLLTDIECDQEKPLKVVLIGQPELRQILSQDNVSEISQRITSRYHLLPFDRENCFSYIHHRLSMGGEQEEIFSKAAMVRVFELSSGIPRLVNVLCDKALQIAFQDKKYLVSPQNVEKAGREVLGDLSGDAERPTRKQLWFGLIVAVLLFLIGGGAVSYYVSQQASVSGSPATVTEKTAVPERGAVVEPPSDEKSNMQNQPAGVEEKKVKIRIIPLKIEE